MPADAAPPTTSPWTHAGSSASLGREGGLVTLVEGSTFCLSGRAGDVAPGMPHGLFVGDARIVSRWLLSVAGGTLEPLTVAVAAPFDATFVGRVHPGGHEADTSLIVMRRRQVGRGMREVIRAENYSTEETTVEIRLDVGVDFAGLFEVKESRVPVRSLDATGCEAGRMWFSQTREGVARHVEVRFDVAPSMEAGSATWTPTIEAHGTFEVCIEVRATVGDQELEPRFRCGVAELDDEPHSDYAQWQAMAPVVETDDAALARSVTQAIDDLGALRIFDEDHPHDAVVAAGAPWFMALFGRDSLLASWMALPADPSLARGVLATLARLQGTSVDRDTEEEPGRILHEVRFGDATSLALGDGTIYYGTADATPLFVMLAGELSRWGPDDGAIAGLLPAVDRALDWMRDHGDRDGDGYIEYARSTAHGLRNQGWKDSWDGIAFADGRLAEPPIALCEVQAYTYAAYRARAHLAAEAGDPTTAARYRELAVDLRDRFNRDFWLDDRDCFAVGLDADKRPIDAVTSNIGHCLWAGIVDDDHAASIARHLVGPELFSGWGVRTLATSMARYNPVSYHNGSVWPHDTAICAAGLMRYGFVDEAHVLIRGLLDVAATMDGRLPELFAGIDRARLSVPAAYPTSCVPQAWAAAAPLLMARCLLGLDPSAGERTLHLTPAPLPGMERLMLHGLRVGGSVFDAGWQDGAVRCTPIDGWELATTPRPPTGEETIEPT